jgi:hypothetical protein
MSDRAYSSAERTHFEQMQAMLSGHFLAQCLHVAAVLNIPDLIAKGRASLEELVAATGCHGPSLHRFLRVLANAGVLTEETGGRFGLTGLGATLRSDAANTVRDMALFRVSSPIWSAWGALTDSLKTGQPSFPRLHDTTIYTYLAEHEELGAIYNRFMTGQSRLYNAAIIDAYDFTGIHLIVDVGGGHGATLKAILDGYPTAKGLLFDVPAVIATVSDELTALGDRCHVAEGDMLKAVPARGDVYVIKNIMMDKADADAVLVLKNCRSAMKWNSRVLVIDPMLPEGANTHPNWLTDMNMLVVYGGRCRTQDEFRSLFDTAGFELTKVIATNSPNFILEAMGR